MENDGTKPSRSRAHRFDAGLPAVLLHERGEYECEAENFSRSGLLLRGPLPVPDVEDTTLILKSVGGDLQIPIRVRVVRKEVLDGGEGARLAVEFAEDDSEKREGLEMLLQRVIEGHSLHQELPEIRPGTSPHEIKKLLEAVPLPHRIGLASRGSPPEREILLHDHHPQVLEALCRNPGLLPHEARTLAGSLHLFPSTLTILANDGRWAADVELKILVIVHARVPIPVAERLIAGLPAPALRRALLKSSLNAHVRTTILKRLSRP